jgi:hypothetical protein
VGEVVPPLDEEFSEEFSVRRVYPSRVLRRISFERSDFWKIGEGPVEYSAETTDYYGEQTGDEEAGPPECTHTSLYQ